MSLAKGKEVSAEELHKAYVEIFHHSLFHIKSTALFCVVGLGVPSTIHRRGGAASVPDIVADTGVHPSKLPYLGRVMRMLTFSGVFAVDRAAGGSEPIYKLNPVSQMLVGDRESASYDMSAMARLMARPNTAISPFFCMEAWLKDASATTLFKMAHDVDPWTSTKNDPSYNKCINEASAMDSSIIMDFLLKEVGGTDHIFQGIRSLVDVGGGNGAAAKAIARAFPHIKCSVLDLEQVINQAHSEDGTVQFISGDIFQSIPQADAAFIKSVLNCWDDDACVKILQQCKRAIPSRDDGGKVIIVSIVLGHGAQDNVMFETQALLDLSMMRQCGAEGEEHEWRKIFQEAGFSDYKITPILGFQSLIEVFP